MGYELRRWLADRLPAEMSSGERLVALEIADQAHEDTRRAYGRELLEIVVRRTGLADQKQLGKVLGKLGERGIELRVPVRDRDGQVVTDVRGRVLYACKGHALEFRIPRADECPALLVPREEELQSSPGEGSNEHKAPPLGAQSSPARGTKLPQAGDPSPQSPQNLSSLTPPTPADPPAPPAAPNSERETIVQHPDAGKVLTAYADAAGRPMLGSPRTKMLADASERLAAGIPLAWLIDRARELPAKSWTDLAQHCDRSTVPTTRQAPDGREPWCKQCGDPTYRMIKDPARDNELVECDTCHPAAVARRRRAQAGAAA